MNELTQTFIVLGIIVVFLVTVIILDIITERKETKLRKQK